MKNYLNNNNIPDKKILELGSPQHDIYFKEDNSMNLNNSILIATNSYLHFSFAGSETNTFERLELFIKKIFANIKEKTDKKIIVKLHPGQTRSNIHKLIKSIDPNVPIYDNTDLLKLISACDAVISLNFSTIILESMMLKKPTMTILPEKQDFELEPVIKQGATLSVSELDEFDSKFDDLFNNEVREKIIHKGTNFVNDFFSNQGTASQNIARELDKFSK